MKFNRSVRRAAALSLLAVSAAAQATVVNWVAAVDAVFDPLTVLPAVGVTVSNANRSLDWGTGGTSGLDITNVPVNVPVITNGPFANTVIVTHRNQPINGATLESVTLDATITLTPVLPAGPALAPVLLSFGVRFLETPNGDAVCADGQANGVGDNINGCADIFVIDTGSLNFAFNYDDDGAGPDPIETYFISIFDSTNGLVPLAPAACLAVTGSNAPCLGFTTPEGANTSSQFALTITTDPVGLPEPGALLLAGLGLTGLAATRRRRGA